MSDPVTFVMKEIVLNDVAQFVSTHIESFHTNKLKSLTALKLEKVLQKKNPYLFRAKNITVASNLITEVLDAFLTSSEEKLFGDFLEELAVFIASQAANGRKSSATGIDLEFEDNSTCFLISIKSGPNWGNSSQQKKQQQDFLKAASVLKQSKQIRNVQPVLGICYGKTKTKHHQSGYLKVVGQSFWHFISGKHSLYTDIIEPLGYRAGEHNEDFLREKARIINQFTEQFLERFCFDGNIDWEKIVRLNSQNMPAEVVAQ